MQTHTYTLHIAQKSASSLLLKLCIPNSQKSVYHVKISKQFLQRCSLSQFQELQDYLQESKEGLLNYRIDQTENMFIILGQSFIRGKRNIIQLGKIQLDYVGDERFLDNGANVLNNIIQQCKQWPQLTNTQIKSMLLKLSTIMISKQQPTFLSQKQTIQVIIEKIKSLGYKQQSISQKLLQINHEQEQQKLQLSTNCEIINMNRLEIQERNQNLGQKLKKVTQDIQETKKQIQKYIQRDIKKVFNYADELKNMIKEVQDKVSMSQKKLVGIQECKKSIKDNLMQIQKLKKDVSMFVNNVKEDKQKSKQAFDKKIKDLQANISKNENSIFQKIAVDMQKQSKKRQAEEKRIQKEFEQAINKTKQAIKKVKNKQVKVQENKEQKKQLKSELQLIESVDKKKSGPVAVVSQQKARQQEKSRTIKNFQIPSFQLSSFEIVESRVKRIGSETQGIVGVKPIQQQSTFKIKIINSKYWGINVGIKNVLEEDEKIMYGGNGFVSNCGKIQYGKGDGLNDGDVVQVTIDFENKKISWKIQNNELNHNYQTELINPKISQKYQFWVPYISIEQQDQIQIL